MPSETGDRRPTAAVGSHPPPKLAEPLPCPRCDSTNTKFCYYNNYNLSQPRHFCKACRRYWTHGGSLRNIPVGGGTRKATKRSRSSSSPTSTSSTSTSTLSTFTHDPESIPLHGTGSHENPGVPELKEENSVGLNLKENLAVSENGNFLSLLNSQGSGFLGMNGYGSGCGYGLCDVGLGFGGRGVFPYPGMGCIGGGNGGPLGLGASGCNTWQQVGDVEGGDDGGSGSGSGSGWVDADGFVWPDIAISSQGKGLK